MPYIDRDEIPFTFVHGRLDDVYVSQEKIMQMPTADVVDKKLYDRLLENAIIISAALNNYQTADMVEVVRCKDCKHRGYIVKDSRGYEWIEYEETSHCPFQCYDDDYYNRLSEDDFFCANGERREDG